MTFFHIFRDSGPNGIWLIKGVGLLNINLMASVLSFVDLSTKLAAMRVCRGFHEVLQCGDSWDPLVVNRFQCQGMLRFVRASWFSASRLREDCKWKFCRLPPAFHQVSVLDIDLMDAERSVRDQSDTEDEERRPIPLTIVSPLREFSRGCQLSTGIHFSQLPDSDTPQISMIIHVSIVVIFLRLALLHQDCGAYPSQHRLLFHGL